MRGGKWRSIRCAYYANCVQIIPDFSISVIGLRLSMAYISLRCENAHVKATGIFQKTSNNNNQLRNHLRIRLV